MSLTQKLRTEIETRGPISVADFMAAALGDPEYGYYVTKDPFGLAGDFITSPEISQIFGELLGIWSAECWHQLGSPEIDVVELGPGRGTLMKDFLRATCHVPGFHEAAKIHLVETSPLLRKAQEESLRGKHPSLSWHDVLPKTNRPMLVVANEFFDALPIRQFVKQKDGVAERMVEWNQTRAEFSFVTGEIYKNLPGEYPKTTLATMHEGAVVEQCPLAQRIMDEIAQHIATYGGAGIFIDYGYERLKDLQAQVTGDTLQAVRQHGFHSVLDAPGDADITAHVDFTTLADIAACAGARVASVQSQREFMLKMGGKLRMQQLFQHANSSAQQEHIASGFERLVSSNAMGDLFKVLAITCPAIHAPVFEEML